MAFELSPRHRLLVHPGQFAPHRSTSPSVAQAASHSAEDVVERRQHRHLLSEAKSPEFLVARLLRRELGGHRVALATAEGELLFDLGDQRREVDDSLAREVPEIVEVARLVPGLFGERDELLDRDFLERVDPHRRVLGQVGVLVIAA